MIDLIGVLALPGAQVPLVPLAKGYYGYVLSDRQGHFHRTSTFEGQEYEKEEEPRESALCASSYCEPIILLIALLRMEIDLRTFISSFVFLSSTEHL